MKRHFPILLVCLAFAATAFSQEEVYTTKSKKAINNFKEARHLFETNQINEAIKPLQTAIKEDSNFVEAHALLGGIYEELGKCEEAVAEFKKVAQLNDPEFESSAFYHIGYNDLALGHYDEGEDFLTRFNEMPRVNPNLKAGAALMLDDCKFGKEAIKHPVPFNPQNMGAAINSPLWEYFPTMSADRETFIFTRRLVDEESEEGFQEDLFESVKINGEWAPAINIGYPLNTPHYNEGAPTLSADGKVLIFASDRPGGYGSVDLYFSIKQGNQWSEGRNLGRPVNSYNWESQPCLSADGRSLYFVRGNKNADPKTLDIYVTVLSDTGTWTMPQRLSDSINTPGTDSYPFIAADNQTLYFCSNSWPGMGGMDIYMSRRKPDGSWSTAKNLGYPINSSKDETSIIVDPNGQLAYFSSDRPGGFGGQDIYSFPLYDSIRPTPITYMKGKVFDARNNNPLAARFSLIDLSTGSMIMQSISRRGDGSFIVCIPLHKNYALNVAKKGYLFYSENFEMQDSGADRIHPYLVNVPLQPIDTGAKIILKNVFFPTNKYDLKPESQVELDKLVSFLTLNPTVKIEISGHTDNVGNAKDNLLLSEHRAGSVYDYLVAHGIATDRLTHKGYGDKRPIATNQTDAGRAQNRRTELKITAI